MFMTHSQELDPSGRGGLKGQGDYPDSFVDLFRVIHETAEVIAKNQQDLAVKRRQLIDLRLEEAILRWRDSSDPARLAAEAEAVYTEIQSLFLPLMKEGNTVDRERAAARQRLLALREQFGGPASLDPKELYLRRKTVVSIDLAGYGAYSDFLKDNLGILAVRVLNDDIARLIDQALETHHLLPQDFVLGRTGDGALLALDRPSDALKFADAFYTRTQEYNARKVGEAAHLFRLWFRVGAADEVLDYRKKGGGKVDAAGTVIRDAVRLEAFGRPGELFVDEQCFQALGQEEQSRFEHATTEVRGKHESERYTVYRCVFLPNAAREAEEAGRWKPKTPPSPETSV
jgi:class 3 adenylate cyclase